MKPGEYFIESGEISLNEGKATLMISVANKGDRPIQVGSHYHFYETNSALEFERELTRGFRPNIPAGTAIRFEPGPERELEVVEYAGNPPVVGVNGKVKGKL